MNRASLDEQFRVRILRAVLTEGGTAKDISKVLDPSVSAKRWYNFENGTQRMSADVLHIIAAKTGWHLANYLWWGREGDLTAEFKARMKKHARGLR